MQVNKILKTHSKWLWANGYKTEAKDCIRQANHKNDYRDKKGKKFKVRNKKGQFIRINYMKRTGVQIMPRAIPCTSSYDPERVASEPLLLQEYVHGNCRGLYE